MNSENKFIRNNITKHTSVPATFLTEKSYLPMTVNKPTPKTDWFINNLLDLVLIHNEQI